MKSRAKSVTKSASVRSAKLKLVAAEVSPELSWSSLGRSYRVGVWPEPVFMRTNREGAWEAYAPDPEADEFAAAAVLLGAREWARYLDFAPTEVAAFMAGFGGGKLEAWAVLTQCPELLPVLAEAPALASFLAGHVSLLGAEGPRWAEIRAVYERGGHWALLDWLGLPATHKGWEALRGLQTPEIARKDLLQCRARLWAVPGARLSHALAA
ncbi:MAG: hypothetical protein NTU80_07930 [Verrucomicrobia bacterium]|nr:hypothetical protein [Verrucomicrobiota bacterium]